jgi:predicted RNA-binding Zn ribbon-like protein
MTEQRPAPLFLADAIGLDFLNSIATPLSVPVDWITSGEDLLEWLATAGLVPREVSAEFAKNALPGELEAIAFQSRALREWFRDFVYAHKGKPLTSDAAKRLEPLNRVLARDEQFGQIVLGSAADKDGLSFQVQRRWRSADSLLAVIAQAMADVVCHDDFTHIKACEGHDCTLVFMDRTRGHIRRWCSMAVCGNRTKIQAYRDRAKQARMK